MVAACGGGADPEDDALVAPRLASASTTAVTWSIVEGSCGSITSAGVYTAPAAASATTCRVVARSTNSSSVSGQATVSVTASTPVAAAPSFSPVPGTYSAPQTVTLSTATTGASIYYTLDGTMPTASSLHYTGSIMVAATATVTAIAIATGYQNSNVSSAAYAISNGASTLRLGVNSSVVEYYEAPVLADAIKQAQPFKNSTLDARGWPTGASQIFVMTRSGVMNPTPQDGTYKLSFSNPGGATVDKAYSTGTVTFSNLVTSGGVTTVDVNVGPDVSTFALGFSKGVTNVKLIRPGNAASAVWDSRLLQRLRNFRVLRVFNFRGQQDMEQDWATRNVPANASWSSWEGWDAANHPIPWEALVNLANTASVDLWINIPFQATDDYVTKLAQLLRYGADASGNPYTSTQASPVWAPLASNLNVYFEFVNELWNGVYHTTGANQSAAAAEHNAGDPYHYETTNTNSLGYYRTARRTVEISNIFRSVWGDAAMMTRIRPVIASQLINSGTYDGVSYVNRVYGPSNSYGNPQHPVSYYLYGVAGAPYFEGTGSTVAALASSMQSQINNSWLPAINSLSSLASTWGIKLCMYEMGQTFSGTDPNFLAIQNDPTMTTALLTLYHAMAAKPNMDVAIYYNLVSNWGASGYYWGLTPDISSEAGAKWDAIRAIQAGQ
jgi:hypothetical protein